MSGRITSYNVCYTKLLRLSEEFGPDREKARRRLNAFLARRGFTGAAARGALEALVRESREG